MASAGHLSSKTKKGQPGSHRVQNDIDELEGILGQLEHELDTIAPDRSALRKNKNTKSEAPGQYPMKPTYTKSNTSSSENLHDALPNKMGGSVASSNGKLPMHLPPPSQQPHGSMNESIDFKAARSRFTQSFKSPQPIATQHGTHNE